MKTKTYDENEKRKKNEKHKKRRMGNEKRYTKIIKIRNYSKNGNQFNKWKNNKKRGNQSTK